MTRETLKVGSQTFHTVHVTQVLQPLPPWSQKTQGQPWADRTMTSHREAKGGSGQKCAYLIQTGNDLTQSHLRLSSSSDCSDAGGTELSQFTFSVQKSLTTSLLLASMFTVHLSCITSHHSRAGFSAVKSGWKVNTGWNTC